MRKFSFLLAIVAVFAMSACAFAGQGDLSNLATPTTPSDFNNGALSAGDSGVDHKTDVYYIGSTVPTFKLGVDVTLTATGNAADMIAYQLKGGTVEKTTKASNATPVADVPVTVKNFTADMSPITFGVVLNGQSAFDNAAKKTLAVNPVQVTFAANNNDVKIKTSAKTADETDVKFVGTYGDGTATIKDLGSMKVYTLGTDGKPTTTEVTSGGNAVIGTGATDVVMAKFDASTGTLTIYGGSNSAGEKGKSIKLGLVKAAKGDGEVEVSSSGPTVAGTETENTTLDATDVIETVTISTVDYFVYPETAAFDIDSTISTLAVSIDMKNTEFDYISTDLKGFNEMLITKADELGTFSTTQTYASNDIVISADKPEAGQMNISFDATLLTDMGDAIVTAKRASVGPYADISEDVKINIVDTNGKFASVVFTFTQDGETPPPAKNVVLPSLDVKDRAALADVSDDLGITIKPVTGATNFSEQGVAYSDDRYMDGIRISESCGEGEAVAFGAGKTFSNSNTEDNRSFQLVKRFVVGATSSDVPLMRFVDPPTAGSRTYTLNAAVVIINDEYDKDQYGNVDAVLGANNRYAVKFIPGNDNKSNVIVIWDGNGADGYANDPIGLKAVNYHSSSSSCSMGFGLAAVAGLAALALRKRSK